MSIYNCFSGKGNSGSSGVQIPVIFMGGTKVLENQTVVNNKGVKSISQAPLRKENGMIIEQ